MHRFNDLPWNAGHRDIAGPLGGLYHHLTVTGPADAAAAHGPGVIPWWIDGVALEENVFNLAVGQPLVRRALDVAGCRILARQFRDRVEACQARAAASAGAAPGTTR